MASARRASGYVCCQMAGYPAAMPSFIDPINRCDVTDVTLGVISLGGLIPCALYQF